MVIFYSFLLTFTRPGNCWLLMVFFQKPKGSPPRLAVSVRVGHSAWTCVLAWTGLRLGGLNLPFKWKVSLKIIKIDFLKRHQKYCIVFVVLLLSLFCFCLCSMRHLSGGLTDNRMSWSHGKTLGGQSHTMVMVTFWILLGRIWTTFW